MIGQACEVRWREAKQAAFDAEHNRLFREESDIQALWSAAQNVPVANRRQWHAGDEGETHRADVGTELHMLDGTPDDPGPPSSVIRISDKPPRGTRTRIIAEVARQFSQSESAIDNLWQAYRRFVREADDSAET